MALISSSAVAPPLPLSLGVGDGVCVYVWPDVQAALDGGKKLLLPHTNPVNTTHIQTHAHTTEGERERQSTRTLV